MTVPVRRRAPPRSRRYERRAGSEYARRAPVRARSPPISKVLTTIDSFVIAAISVAAGPSRRGN